MNEEDRKLIIWFLCIFFGSQVASELIKAVFDNDASCLCGSNVSKTVTQRDEVSSGQTTKEPS